MAAALTSKITRGRRSLLAVLQRTTQREVAARCGVTFQAVSYWAQGIQKPTTERREKLEQLYGIACCAWDAEYVPPPR